MGELSIKVEVAGRTYPLSVQHEEEENVRKAANEINEAVKRIKQAYPHTDILDLLAMASLEVSTRAMNSAGMADRKGLEDELTKLEALIDSHR